MRAVKHRAIEFCCLRDITMASHVDAITSQQWIDDRAVKKFSPDGITVVMEHAISGAMRRIWLRRVVLQLRDFDLSNKNLRAIFGAWFGRARNFWVPARHSFHCDSSK
jgi:hypothetical protein